jgi:hypothetical protein
MCQNSFFWIIIFWSSKYILHHKIYWRLQYDINLVQKWFIKNYMKSSILKTNIISFTCKMNNIHFNYYVLCWWYFKQVNCKRSWRTPSSWMWYRVDLVWANISPPHSQIFLPWRWRLYVPPKLRFTQDLHGATSQKVAFFIVTTVKTSNFTCKIPCCYVR